jgi:hypothetical protein
LPDAREVGLAIGSARRRSEKINDDLTKKICRDLGIPSP